MLVGLNSSVVGPVERRYCVRIEDRKDLAEVKEEKSEYVVNVSRRSGGIVDVGDGGSESSS